MDTAFEITIHPRKGWQALDLKEAFSYRELLGFLVWRDIKIRYRQTLLGGLWAVIQPLMGMFVFTFVFNRWAGVKSDGPPYPLFAFAGLASWNFFAAAVAQSSNSLVASQSLVSKVYFPRIFLPLGSMGALLLDMGLSLCMLAALMVYYHWKLTLSVFLLPLFIAAAVLAAGGLGLMLSALNVRFRDVKYAVPFIMQMGIFLTPVIYPIRYIPAKWQFLMGLNPMAGVVLGFRYALLGTPASWTLMGISLAVSVLLFVVGLFVFRRMESEFADII